ncbi:MAG: hypothetical protein R3F11_18155 [Verrucomicrobiales bacterium]
MRLAALILLSALAACRSVPPPPDTHIDGAPAAQVSRTEALRIAEAYRLHAWVPGKANAFHGFDAHGIRVDTPDIDFQPGGETRPGWWIAGRRNIGIPYQWGGFDTPATFDAKLRRGFYAGDIYTAQKRRELDDAVSAQACGIDCSGFISRCWRLGRSFSTRELESLCTPLPDFADLRPGDLINKPNVHALLFERFTDESKTVFQAYETGSPPTWKVERHTIPVDYVKGLGYRPFRYRRIID